MEIRCIHMLSAAAAAPRTAPAGTRTLPSVSSSGSVLRATPFLAMRALLFAVITARPGRSFGRGAAQCTYHLPGSHRAGNGSCRRHPVAPRSGVAATRPTLHPG